MKDMYKTRLDDFVLSMCPAIGYDGVWVNWKKDLTVLVFDGNEMRKEGHHVPGTAIGTNFVVSSTSGSSKVFIREGRGISLLDLEHQKDELAFVPATLSPPISSDMWVRYADPAQKHILAPYSAYFGDQRFVSSDEKLDSLQLFRITLPALDKIPKDPDGCIGLPAVQYTHLDFDLHALTFPGPHIVLIRQKDAVQPKKIRWSAVDFDLKAVPFPLADLLNQYRDSLPDITQVLISEKRSFALLGSETPMGSGQIFMASWKKRSEIKPILFHQMPLGKAKYLLLSPADDRCLIETEEEGQIYLGAIVETDSSFNVSLRSVYRFFDPKTQQTGSNLLSWFGSGKGFVAGVWDENETDLFVWHLPLPEPQLESTKP